MANKNPLNLKLGDRVLIQYTDKNKTEIPKMFNGKWVEVHRFSPQGIPETYFKRYRSIKSENVKTIRNIIEKTG